MRFDDLKIRQLDVVLTAFDSLKKRPTPDAGWIRTIREALGMSLRQLASRAQLSKNAVASAERSEAKGTIQLDTLRVLAEALDCELVYALVPRQSLSATIDNQAARISGALVGRVSESMELEDQGISVTERSRQFDELKQDIIRRRGRDFWDAE